MESNNPANEKKVSLIPEGYIPMSAPIQRLQVPEREGYRRHWFRGEPGRIQRALQAGYQFVNPDEVRVNNFDLGGNKEDSGNTDLGTRVSIAAGDEAEAGRLYLMEVPEELYEYGLQLLGDINDSVVEALTAGTTGSEREDRVDKSRRYRKGAVPELFKKKI